MGLAGTNGGIDLIRQIQSWENKAGVKNRI